MEETKWFLGEIDWVGHRGHYLTGSFFPLFEESTEAQPANRAFDDASRYDQFPNQGRISWWSPHDAVKIGEVFHFTIEDQPTYEAENARHDKFRVRDARKAAQVIDLSGISVEEARLLLTEEGINLPNETLSEYCIRLCGSLWSEPLPFVQSSESHLWIIDPNKSRNPLRWQEWTCEDHFLIDLGKTKVLGVNAKLQGKLKLLDWCPDATLLDRVMKRLRSLDRAFSDSLQLSANAIKKLADVHATNAARGNLDLENARIERACLLLQRVKNHTDAAQVAAALLETEPMRQELAEKTKQILEYEREKAQKHVLHELEAEHKNVEFLKQEASATKAEIAGLRAEQEAFLHEFDATLGARLKEIFSSPEKFLVELSLLKAALDILSPERTSASTTVKVEMAIGTIAIEEIAALPAQQLITSVDELKQNLEEAFERSGVSPAFVHPLHASLLSGTVPVFAGAWAYEACASYSRCVTARSLFWLPIAPTLVEPAQMLGESASGPEPGGLLQFLVRAQTSKHMHLVVLEGINKAPIDSYLMPILCCYRDAWHGPGGRLLPLRLHLSSFPWPRNVLLAAIHSEGMVSISPPKSFWNHCTLIHGSLFAPTEAKSERTMHPDKLLSDALNCSERAVAVSQWASWRATCEAQELEPCVKLWSKFDSEFALGPESRNLCLRFFAAIRTVHPEVAQGIGETIAYCLITQLAREPEKAVDRLSGIPLPYKDIGLALSLTAELLN